MARAWATLMVAAVSAVGCLPPGPARAADDPLDLLKYIPPQANAVVVVNVDNILSSPRAVKEGWAKLDRTEYLAGAVPVNPAVERIVLAKHLNPVAPGHGPILAVMPVKKPIDAEKLAARLGGEVTSVADEPAVVTQTGTVLFPLAPQILGVALTETRQDVARWARYIKGSTASPLSKYLNTAIYGFGKRHHIAIAVDAQDLFEPSQARTAVAQSTSLPADDAKAGSAVEKFLTGLRGVLFLADVTPDGITAQVRVAGGPTAGLKPDVLKKFFIEVVERNGASLENLAAATARVEEGVFTLTFPISDPELARVMALFLPPLPPSPESEGIAISSATITPEATRRYYQAVTRILDDLKKQNEKASDYTKTALWHETAANQIESLSVIGVDKVVVEFGHGTASRVRAIADSLRGVPIQAAAVESQGYVLGYMPRTTAWMPGRGFRLNPWLAAGPQSVSTNLPEIRQKEAELIKKDAENRAKLWESIEQKQSDVRRAMADKYQLDSILKK